MTKTIKYVTIDHTGHLALVFNERPDINESLIRIELDDDNNLVGCEFIDKDVDNDDKTFTIAVIDGKLPTVAKQSMIEKAGKHFNFAKGGALRRCEICNKTKPHSKDATKLFGKPACEDCANEFKEWRKDRDKLLKGP